MRGVWLSVKLITDNKKSCAEKSFGHMLTNLLTIINTTINIVTGT